MTFAERRTWRIVALLAEGVDRNFGAGFVGSGSTVALLAEGVDRNFIIEDELNGHIMSPSSRRAWIEIHDVGRWWMM